MVTKKLGRPRVKDKKVFIGVYVHPGTVNTKAKADEMRARFKRIADRQANAEGLK